MSFAKALDESLDRRDPVDLEYFRLATVAINRVLGHFRERKAARQRPDFEFVLRVLRKVATAHKIWRLKKGGGDERRAEILADRLSSLLGVDLD